MSNTTYRSAAHDAADEVADVARDAKNVASDVADDVASAASRVQERASALGRKAVDQFNATTDYFREHEVKQIASDLTSWMKSHPTQALVGAVALGFIAGALLRRR